MRLNQQGFTLTEVVIALMVTTVLAGAVMVFMMSSIGNYAAASTRGEMLDQAQLALDVINNDILLSSSADQNNRIADANAPGGQLLGWESDADTLILATAAQNSNGDILFSDASQYISHKNNSIYYLNGTNLYRRTLAASVTGNTATTSCPPASATTSCPADTLLLERVSSLTFTYLNGDDDASQPTDARSVEVSITLSDRKFGTDISVTQTTRTVFRND